MGRRVVQFGCAGWRYSLSRYEGRGRGGIVQNSMLGAQKGIFLWHPAVRCAILIIEKGKTTAHKGLTFYKMVIELPPCYWSKFWGGFLCLKHYLINVNTNVSNARMNIPKAIRSLKSYSVFTVHNEQNSRLFSLPYNYTLETALNLTTREKPLTA